MTYAHAVNGSMIGVIGLAALGIKEWPQAAMSLGPLTLRARGTRTRRALLWHRPYGPIG